MTKVNQNESNMIFNSQQEKCCALTTKNNRCKMKVKEMCKDGAWHGVCLCQLHYNMVPFIRTIYHENPHTSPK